MHYPEIFDTFSFSLFAFTLKLPGIFFKIKSISCISILILNIVFEDTQSIYICPVDTPEWKGLGNLRIAKFLWGRRKENHIMGKKHKNVFISRHKWVEWYLLKRIIDKLTNEKPKALGLIPNSWQWTMKLGSLINKHIF